MATRIPTTDADLNRFWMGLSLALTRREIPSALVSDRAMDVGWGRGCRILAIGRGGSVFVFNPLRGCFAPVPHDPATLAADIEGVFRLTRREREVLTLLREGAPTYADRGDGNVRVGEGRTRQRARRSLFDRLALLGLVDELANGSGSEWVAVQPEPVRRR